MDGAGLAKALAERRLEDLMSENAFRQCLERMKTDEASREKVLAVGDVEDGLALLQAEGYDCTAAEIGQHGEPLDDDTLDRVTAAGGFSQYGSLANGCNCNY